MTLTPCSREREVSELLARGQWPTAGAPDLRTHVRSCGSCADLVLVTQTMQRARAETTNRANLVSPGAIWWRAQLRRRNAAVECVGKPILGAQIFALSTYLLIAVAFLASQARHGIHWLTWFAGIVQLPQARSLHLEALWPSSLLNSGGGLPLLIPVLATVALLGGVVVFLVSEKQ